MLEDDVSRDSALGDADEGDFQRSLDDFSGNGYEKGRSFPTQAVWMLVQGLLFTRWWCPSIIRVGILRLFGAKIGSGVLIRHGVRVHWPWKLSIGDSSWIGEGVWILNLEPISIGHDTCISQSVFLCSGSHNRRSPTFEFDNAPIVVGNGVWVAARATVLRGVVIGNGATIGATALVTKSIGAGSIVLAGKGSKIL